MGQAWDPAGYARHAAFVPQLGAGVVELLAPRPGERILDLGCGDGALTVRLMALGCDVVGVDASPAMVAAARQRGVPAMEMDGHSLSFVEEFDAVFSNAALHWMTRPDAVIAGVWRALKPGGRFVGELGGHGNVGSVIAALKPELAARGLSFEALNPWYFPTAEEYRARLEAAGFKVRVVQLIPRPTPLPTDLRGWLHTFAQRFLEAVPPEERDAFLRAVEERCRPVLQGADGRWQLDYVRLRFAAEKPKGAA
ncbi:MAG TPA: methyltransferase domain-containing protein [Limnochordales bacterium]|nr:methyltransferase domain-containing protein [Limnochordales bacterium]